MAFAWKYYNSLEFTVAAAAAAADRSGTFKIDLSATSLRGYFFKRTEKLINRKPDKMFTRDFHRMAPSCNEKKKVLSTVAFS